jgi:dUTP pyrophosphatase
MTETLAALNPTTLDVELKRIDPELELPSYAQDGDAGADLRTTEDVTLEPGERHLIPTGISVALPEGHVAFIKPRSGLAVKNGIQVLGGVIDAGYRGEIKAILLNTDLGQPVTFRRGDRIAQLVIQRVEQARFIVADELGESARGAGGFGSTGGFTS